jgi:hypothetical protein
MRKWIGRIASDFVVFTVLATALATVSAMPRESRLAACTNRVALADGRADAWAPGPDADPMTSHGIDLEVRVLNLRIEFPWLKALPITPVHHIVITMLPESGAGS